MHILRYINAIPRDQPCPDCGRFSNRGVSIDAVIIQVGQVLLVQRGVEPYKGSWATPGGYVEWDETTEQTVTREVKEETGLTVESCQLVGVRSSPDRHPKQVINLVYRVSVAEGEPVKGDDAADVQWFSLENLPETLAFDHEQNIEDSLKLS